MAESTSQPASRPATRAAIPTVDVEFVTGIVGEPMSKTTRKIGVNEPPPMPLNDDAKVVGKPTTRLDGRLKVTGGAKYTADINLPGMLQGVILSSPHASAKIKSIDTSAAEKMPGVKAIHVLTKLLGGAQSRDEDQYPRIRYAGQPIAAVAAQTIAQARDALAKIDVEYEILPFVVDIEKAQQPDAPLVFAAPAEQAGTAGGGGGPRNVQQKGNVRGPARSGKSKEEMDAAFAKAEIIIEREFHTQVQTHSALETHGVVADFKPDMLTVYASTQGTISVRNEMAALFGLPNTKVRVITEFMGGGFGAKFGAGNWGALAGFLSQKAGAPVKLMCDRKLEHMGTGNRPSSNQKIRLGAMKDGSLVAISFSNYGTGGTGTGSGAGGPSRSYYSCPNFSSEESDVFIHAGPQAAFRAPGFPQGAFSIEQVIDELAEKTGIDPLDLRDKIDMHPARKVERRIGAEKVNWKSRHAPGADPGPIKRGLGVAQAGWFRGGNGRDSACEVRIHSDGSVELLSAVQDIGGGIRTALAMVVAEELGLKPTDITIRIGDTAFPPGPGSGGSVTTSAITPAARNAAYLVKQKFCQQLAGATGANADDLRFIDAKIVSKSGEMTFKQAAAKMGVDQISAQASRTGDWSQAPGMGGVQFVELTVDTETGVVKVDRVVAVHDCGRPINPLGLQSQINGGVLQGLSYALYEERILDRQTGRMINPNLEQYKIVGARETPIIETHLVQQYHAITSTDAAGIGEPAIIPTAAAIANAFYNATGVRMTRIPMTPANVLSALKAAKETKV